MASTNANLPLIKQLVKEAKQGRKNRVYYKDCFKPLDILSTGIIQDSEKSRYDRVELDPDKNEFIKFYGFNKAGSYFELSLTLLSLYQGQKGSSTPDANQEENKIDQNSFRLGSVDFLYRSAVDNSKYRYSTEQLVDYKQKMSNHRELETKNFYKIGCISLEVVLPFSLSRILFNGLLTRVQEDGTKDLVSCKFTLSTHPTCDKFDYKYRFSTGYLSRVISKCLDRSSVKQQNQPTLRTDGGDHGEVVPVRDANVSNGINLQAIPAATKVQAKLDAANNSELIKKLIDIVLEDRIDQTLMFTSCLEIQSDLRGSIEEAQVERSVMWGAKVKRILSVDDNIPLASKKDRSAYECLYIWSESGQVIHLTRPTNELKLVYGMVNCSYDYPSCLYEAKLFKREGQIEVNFEQLESLAEIPSGMRVQLCAFRSKEINVDFEDIGQGRAARAVVVNGFNGWALGERGCDWFGLQLARAQSLLWTMSLSDDGLFSQQLASEGLLGGKGNSLVDLNRLVEQNTFVDLLPGEISPLVEVPKGLVVTSIAYELWQKNNPLILSSIDELDRTRRALAASSFYVNPFSDKHLSLAQHQKVLKDQCQKTRLVLSSCLLPNALRMHLRSRLVEMFGEEALREPEDGESESGAATGSQVSFAVRSSAVGEDSTDSSAAGQMRTILGVRGFKSICQAVVDCWASQFEQEAVSYKAQNSMTFDLPMAVVVQQLIPCQMAGVGTTCEPLTGDYLQLELLANRGLGEGVVAGKETDTVRVSLKSLEWDHRKGQPLELLKMDDQSEHMIKRMQPTCCLNTRQILTLANVLMKIRQSSAIKAREVEWGITGADEDSDSGRKAFNICLLQSRPLTNLSRLSAREIDHELDYGIGSPHDTCSRANLGEVMPGALCPMTFTYFLLVTKLSGSQAKPYELDHTMKPFVADSFGFHSQMALMVLSSDETLRRFAKKGTNDREEAVQAFQTLLGTTDVGIDHAKRDMLNEERINPLSSTKSRSLGLLLALDMGVASIMNAKSVRLANKLNLTRGLSDMGSLIERIERRRSATKPNESELIELENTIKMDMKKLWSRLCSELDPLRSTWRNHITGTVLSMTFNISCMKILAEQPAYPKDFNSAEVLNDFSILMRGGTGNIESADIGKLLDDLIELLVQEGQLERAQKMSISELYDYLSAPNSQVKSAKTFRKFMRLNGHRAYKEFDLATLTWADDPTYIVKSLAMRLKNRSASGAESKPDQVEGQIREILAKVERNRALLTGYLLPRARLAVKRREKSKSLVIFTVNKYRQALRHLGGLLCLLGRLPSADLVFELAVEELHQLIERPDSADLGSSARLIYKARRREQRARVINQVTWPQPVMDFTEVVETVRKITEPEVGQAEAGARVGDERQVRGLTSCAGCVTGRALVVNSIDDMDQIEPGDILVTYSIDISWSVYFFTLAGIVTEVGGIVSHGAVVAREYGIPTLCTALGACSRFKTGQTITLDANKGVCYLAEGAQDERDDA